MLKTRFAALILCFTIIFTSGCGSTDKTENKTENLAKQVAELKKEVEDLKEDKEDLKQEEEQLKKEKEELKKEKEKLINEKENKKESDSKNNIVLNNGDYLEFGRYYGQPILWTVINKDDKVIMLLSDKILCLKSFDAKGDFTDGRGDEGPYEPYDRSKEGSNYWEKSNIREWLNSSEQVVNYSHQSPSQGYVRSNDYNLEPGFLYDFSEEEREMIQQVENKTLISSYDFQVMDGGDASKLKNTRLGDDLYIYDNMPYKITKDKVFLPSVKEIKEYLYDKGLEYRAKPTTQCLKNDEHEKNLNPTQYYRYILRTPSYKNSYSISSVESNGIVYYNIPSYGGERGIRPALYLKNDTKIIAGNGTAKNPYKIFDSNKKSSNTSKNISSESNSNNEKISLDQAVEIVKSKLQINERDYEITVGPFTQDEDDTECFCICVSPRDNEDDVEFYYVNWENGKIYDWDIYGEKLVFIDDKKLKCSRDIMYYFNLTLDEILNIVGNDGELEDLGDIKCITYNNFPMQFSFDENNKVSSIGGIYGSKIFGTKVGMNFDEIQAVLGDDFKKDFSEQQDVYTLFYDKDGYFITFFARDADGPTVEVSVIKCPF